MKWIEDLPADFTQAFRFSVTGVDNPLLLHFVSSTKFGHHPLNEAVTLSRDEMQKLPDVMSAILPEDLGNEEILLSVRDAFVLANGAQTKECLVVGESIRSISFEGKNLDVFPDLSKLTDLISLNLKGCKSLEDLTPISGLSRLTSLNLGNCRSIKDVSSLANLINLTFLSLESCSIKHLAGLSGLISLTTLNLSGCRSLIEVSALSGLSNLVSLDLAGCSALQDISGLTALSNLSLLSLRGCKAIEELSSINGLDKLTWLDLSDCNALKDISGIAGLSSLRTLDLSGCGTLRELPDVSSLDNLSSLNLSDCKSIKDISGLASLTNLTSLKLSKCRALRDVSAISGLNSLRSLDISGSNYLKDVSVLSGLRSLSSLVLIDCRFLEDVSDLAGLKGLTRLNLSLCESLKDVSVVAGLPNLTELRMGDCPLVDHDFNRRAIAKLDNLSVLEGIAEPWHTTILWNAARKRRDVQSLQDKFHRAIDLCGNAHLDVHELKAGFLKALPQMELSEYQLQSLDQRWWSPAEWSSIWQSMRSSNPTWASQLLSSKLAVHQQVTEAMSDMLFGDQEGPRLDPDLHGWIRLLAGGKEWNESIGWLENMVNWLPQSELRSVGPDLLMALKVVGLTAQETTVLSRLTQLEGDHWMEQVEYRFAHIAVEAGDVRQAVKSIEALPPELADEVRSDLIARWAYDMPDEVAGWMAGFHQEATREQAALGLASSSSNVATSSARHLVLMDLVPNREALLNFIQAMAAGVPDDPWVKALQAEMASTETALSQEILESIGLELLRQDEAVREEVGDRKLRKLIEASGEKAATFREQARRAGMDLLRRQDLID